MITGQYIDNEDFIKRLEYQLSNGVQLVQIRAKSLTEDEFLTLSRIAIEIGKKFDSAKIILNTTPELANSVDADGVHLTSESLMKLKARPMPQNKLVSAACHNADELRKAAELNVNFVTLSPVLHTKTHPEAIPLGWDNFANLCKNYTLPVFALGGMSEQSLESVQTYGAYGFASISWWKKNPD